MHASHQTEDDRVILNYVLVAIIFVWVALNFIHQKTYQNIR